MKPRHHPVWFDIDGTLVHTAVGKAAFQNALRETYGWEDSFEDVRFAGNTDLGVLMDLAERHGGSSEAGMSRKEEFFSRMADHLDRGLARQKPVRIPGAQALISTLEQMEEIGLYLLTGNARTCAFLKLQHADLDRPFQEGGFGDEHADRNVLAARSRQRLEDKLNRNALGEGWVIGDTPRDMMAARSIGARSVGVASGAYRPDELHSAGADRVVENLEDRDGLLRLILNGG